MKLIISPFVHYVQLHICGKKGREYSSLPMKFLVDLWCNNWERRGISIHGRAKDVICPHPHIIARSSRYVPGRGRCHGPNSSLAHTSDEVDVRRPLDRVAARVGNCCPCYRYGVVAVRAVA